MQQVSGTGLRVTAGPKLGVRREEETGVQNVPPVEGFPTKHGAEQYFSVVVWSTKLLPRESLLQPRLCLKGQTEEFLAQTTSPSTTGC